MTDPIVTSMDEGVMTITLNRPESFNSFDEQMGAAFLDALDAASRKEVRSVVITGQGRAFCAGEDLKALMHVYESGDAPDLGDILRRRYIPAMTAILGLPKPVIASVNGVAAGAGVSLALACDYRILADSASLVLAFVDAGLVPDAGATWLLPKYLGVGTALRLAMTGEKVSAGGALELGLASEVIESDRLVDRTSEIAQRFASGPTIAHSLTKELIWRASGGYLEEHLEAEAKAQAAAGRTDDHLEGVRAFAEKRRPQFKGH